MDKETSIGAKKGWFRLDPGFRRDDGKGYAHAKPRSREGFLELNGQISLDQVVVEIS